MVVKKDQSGKISKRGPKEERVKINGDWKDAVSEALKKPRPSDGWPDSDKKKSDDDE